MWILLPLLCVLCATQILGIFDGTCLRKEPPPGVLVLSPGSKLVLTCGGDVRVNGVNVSMARSISNASRGSTSSAAATEGVSRNTGVSMKSDRQTAGDAESGGGRSNPTEAGVTPVTGDNRSLGRTDSGYTASPTTRVVQLTSASRPVRGESSQEAEEMSGESDYEEDEGEEGSMVTRALTPRPQWKVNGVTVGKGDRDWGALTFERRGATLSLSSVRLTDSGKYACYYGRRERLALKVIVTEPPEEPSLCCYKKSPSSKIRCKWAPQRAVTTRPHCYLMLNKRHRTGGFLRQQCSYSSRLSSCWCTLDYNEDELRTPHTAYLCVTSIAGNATSNSVNFTPLEILKPDPPSRVSVQQGNGMTVTWSFPTSWKSQDSFYELIYELKYKPRMSLPDHDQIMHIKGDRSYTITDAMLGVEYVIQLRTKEEYDGQWSDWSAPVYANVSTAQVLAMNDSPPTAMLAVYTYWDDYGTNYTDGPGSVDYGVEVSQEVLWIPGSFALLSVILAAYIFRHKDRIISKLQSLSAIGQCGDSPQPPASDPTPKAPEEQVLVTFAPPHYKEPPPSEVEEAEEENKEEQQVKERTEALHFNNAGYFFLQRWQREDY